MTEVFVEQPLASPGSAKYNIERTFLSRTVQLQECFGEVVQLQVRTPCCDKEDTLNVQTKTFQTYLARFLCFSLFREERGLLILMYLRVNIICI